MRRCLIVANRTIGNDTLTSAVAERTTAGVREFVLVVPAVPSDTPAGAVRTTQQRSSAVGVHDGSKLAAQRLVAGLEWIEGQGAAATGEVVRGDTVDAVVGLVDRHEVGEVIVSTLPKALSKFLRQDLASKIRRQIDVPVTVVTSMH